MIRFLRQLLCWQHKRAFLFKGSGKNWGSYEPGKGWTCYNCGKFINLTWW